MTAEHEITDSDLLIAGHLNTRSIGVGEPVVEALVDGVGDLPGVAQDRDVLAFRTSCDVGVGGLGGHGDRIPGVQAVVVAIPADRFAQPVAAGGPQRQRGVAFGRVAHPPHVREALRPRQVLAEVLEHAAAGLDRGQLVGVADQDHLGSCGRAGLDISKESSHVRHEVAHVLCQEMFDSSVPVDA